MKSTAGVVGGVGRSTHLVADGGGGDVAMRDGENIRGVVVHGS